jgi:hypothetical protein
MEIPCHGTESTLPKKTNVHYWWHHIHPEKHFISPSIGTSIPLMKNF